MTTKHTPGPWVVGTTDGHATYSITGPRGTLPYIARIPAGRLENADNASLIAAAPELLAALESVRDYWSGGDCPPALWGQITQTIARAKGQA